MGLDIQIGLTVLAALVGLIFLGLHIPIALMLLSVIGVWALTQSLDVALSLLAQGANDAIASYEFGVVPLFVLMGLLVSESKIGEDLFAFCQHLLKRVAGGLGIATVFANAIFASVTGVSIASASVFARIASPQLIRFGYTPKFSAGVVAGSSVLGMLIPPSLLMIVYAFLAEQSVGAMFIAGIVPGICLALLFSAYIFLVARFRPGWIMAQAGSLPQQPIKDESFGAIAVKVVPVITLIAGVLGGIYGGIFTATEAGAAGATGAFILAVARRTISMRRFWSLCVDAGSITASVLILVIAASIYSRMLSLSGLPFEMISAINDSGMGWLAVLAIYILIILFLGSILDSVSILLIVVPLMVPVAIQLDMNLIWFGVITVIAVEVGLLTPPFGMSVFVVRSSLDRRLGITVGQIFAGAFPFVLLMLFLIAVATIFPGIISGLG